MVSKQLLTSVNPKYFGCLGSRQMSLGCWRQFGVRVTSGGPSTAVGPGHGHCAVRSKSTGTPSMGSPVQVRGQEKADHGHTVGEDVDGDDMRTRAASSDGLLKRSCTDGLPQWALARGQKSTPPKLLTLVIIHKDGRVLLGMKKRGFGKGYYNGFGGKVEAGEAVDDAASRELQEESGVTPLDLSKRGILTFHFDNDSTPWEVHVYHVSEIVGDPCETEEMAPKWFPVSEIPYGKMWSDDILWYPEFLKGQHFKGSFYFENTTTLVGHSLQVTG